MKCIIFDFDGTIADTTKIVLKIINDLSEKHRYRKIPSVKKLRDMGYNDAIKYLGISKIKLAQLLVEGYRLRKDMKDTHVPIYLGIKSLLRKLKKEYYIVLISRSACHNLTDFINEHRLEGYFDDIIGGSPISKKYKQINDFMKKHKYLSTDAVYVADEERDILSARKAGVKIISVTWGFNSRKALEKENPDFIVDKAEEIIDIIKELH